MALVLSSVVPCDNIATTNALAFSLERMVKIALGGLGQVMHLMHINADVQSTIA